MKKHFLKICGPSPATFESSYLGEVGKHWSGVGLRVYVHFWWPQLSFITLLLENRRQSLGSYQGKKIFLCWNFQNLLSSYIARDISDCQEGVKPVGVSPNCLQRGRNIICLNTSSSESLTAGGLSLLSL